MLEMMLTCKGLQPAGFSVSLLSVIILGSYVQAQTSSSVSISSLPLWKQVFANFTTWTGSYSYNKVDFTCKLQVLNIMKEEGGIVYTEFTDADTTLQFEGRSSDNLTIIMRRSHLYRANSQRITPHRDFEITGHVSKSSLHNGWQFVVSVSKPDFNKQNFSNFRLYTNGGADSVKSTDNDGVDGKRLGLTIGLVVLCVLIGVAVMAGMLIYGIKKGLLRHVPANYKNFKNTKASFDSKQETVHI